VTSNGRLNLFPNFSADLNIQMAPIQSTDVIYFPAVRPRRLNVPVLALEAKLDLFAYFLK
jgi:hypothetical protein